LYLVASKISWNSLVQFTEIVAVLTFVTLRMRSESNTPKSGE
jgi:hypothetical protein